MSTVFVTIRGWLTTYPVLAAGAWMQLGLATCAVVAMSFDTRKILGISPWIKPLKFDISVLIVLVTVAALLCGFERFISAKSWIAYSVSIALSCENILISLQALRGVRSHMNYSTALDARVFMAMGVCALISTLSVASILVLVFAGQPKWPASVTWGVGLGLLMFVAGSAEGALMVKHGGHTVGAADGGHGLPVIDWSTRFGDLRIAHFFALHTLQAFPLLGLLVSRTTMGERLQICAVLAGSALYTIGVWLLFRQAMAGKPLFS